MDQLVWNHWFWITCYTWILGLFLLPRGSSEESSLPEVTPLLQRLLSPPSPADTLAILNRLKRVGSSSAWPGGRAGKRRRRLQQEVARRTILSKEVARKAIISKEVERKTMMEEEAKQEMEWESRQEMEGEVRQEMTTENSLTSNVGMEHNLTEEFIDQTLITRQLMMSSTKLAPSRTDLDLLGDLGQVRWGSVLGLATGIVLGLVAVAGAVLWPLLVYRRQFTLRKAGSMDRSIVSCTESYTGSYADSETFNSISYADCAGIEIPKDNSSDELYNLDNDSFLNSLEAITFEDYWDENVHHTKL